MFPSEYSPPSHIQTSSCRHRTLKHSSRFQLDWRRSEVNLKDVWATGLKVTFNVFILPVFVSKSRKALDPSRHQRYVVFSQLTWENKPFLRCWALRFPRIVTNDCSSVPYFSSPALNRACRQVQKRLQQSRCCRRTLSFHLNCSFRRENILKWMSWNWSNSSAAFNEALRIVVSISNAKHELICIIYSSVTVSR